MTKTKLATTTILAAMAALTLTATFVEARDRSGGRGMNIEQIFERFDADGDGQVTQEEIDGAAETRFSDADTDGDGMLSEAEFMAQAQEQAGERAAERFARLDADGDGMLSRDVLEARRGGQRMERMFNRLDANDDGAITMEEAEAAMERFRERRGGRERSQN